MLLRESVIKWSHRFSKLFSVDRAYIWSAVDVDSGEMLAIYSSQGRNMLIALKFLRMVLGRCINKPLIVVDRGHWYG
jgi:transposase-like protein